MVTIVHIMKLQSRYIIIGQGSPIGVLLYPIFSEYYDIDTANKYINIDGTINGWKLVLTGSLVKNDSGLVLTDQGLYIDGKTLNNKVAFIESTESTSPIDLEANIPFLIIHPEANYICVKTYYQNDEINLQIKRINNTSFEITSNVSLNDVKVCLIL